MALVYEGNILAGGRYTLGGRLFAEIYVLESGVYAATVYDGRDRIEHTSDTAPEARQYVEEIYMLRRLRGQLT